MSETKQVIAKPKNTFPSPEFGPLFSHSCKGRKLEPYPTNLVSLQAPVAHGAASRLTMTKFIDQFRAKPMDPAAVRA